MLTPEAKAIFAELIEPKGFKGSDPKYSVTLVLNVSEHGEFLSEIKAEAEKILANEGIKGRLPIKPETKKDENGEKVPTGNYLVRFSSKTQPDFFDAVGNPTPAIEVGNGSIIRVSYSLYGYDTAGNTGVGAGLRGLQIKELKTYDHGFTNLGEGYAPPRFETSDKSGSDIMKERFSDAPPLPTVAPADIDDDDLPF